MRPSITLTSILLTLTLLGCAGKTGHTFLEEISPTDISQALVPCQTTREEVREKFGDPEEIDFDPSGREKWVYRFVRSEAKGVNYVPIVSSFYSGTNDTKKQLIILFDTTGRVTKHAFSTSRGETKLGAFQ